MRKIYSALDIGSDTLKLVVGEFYNNKLNVLCGLSKQSAGYQNNVITDKEELIKSIKMLVNDVYDKINVSINNRHILMIFFVFIYSHLLYYITLSISHCF